VEFRHRQASLARLAAVPVADFAHAYQLPAGHLRSLSAGGPGRGEGLVYRLHEDRLLTDAEAVSLTYIFRADESLYPPHFAEALSARLAAEFCLPLTESTSRGELLARLATEAFRAARLVDAQEDTPRALGHFPLVEARG